MFFEAYALHSEGSTREAILEAESCVGKRTSEFDYNDSATVDKEMPIS